MQRNGSNNVYLSEIAQIYQPQTISSAELTEDGFLVYGANGIIGKYKDYNHKTEQICITCRGNTCGMVNYTCLLYTSSSWGNLSGSVNMRFFF